MKLRYLKYSVWDKRAFRWKNMFRYSQPVLQFYDEKEKVWKNIEVHCEEVTII